MCFVDQSNNILMGIFLWAIPLIILMGSKAHWSAVLLKQSIVNIGQWLLSAHTETYSPTKSAKLYKLLCCSVMEYCEFVIQMLLYYFFFFVFFWLGERGKCVMHHSALQCCVWDSSKACQWAYYCLLDKGAL